jgi:1-acyl-sn-glycerol-3-phosphate acyltransferase
LTVLRALRSLLAFLALMASFVLVGLVQRALLPLFAIWPATKQPMMDRLMQRMAAWVLLLVRVGGGRLRRTGTIPTSEPVLILMNHQSLLDIPTAICLCRPHVPVFVTRRLYARYIPMVSLMLRIRDDPLVDPEKDPRGSIAALKRAARVHQHGIVLFPEGHRSPGGEVSPFQPAGLRVILGERKAPVYLVATDGFWTCRELFDFLFDMGRIDGRTEVMGPFDPPDPRDFSEFATRMQHALMERVSALRRADH